MTTCPHVRPPSLLDVSATIAQCATCDALSASPYDLFYRCEECGRIDCAQCRFPESFREDDAEGDDDKRGTSATKRRGDSCQDGHLFMMVSDPVSTMCTVCGKTTASDASGSSDGSDRLRQDAKRGRGTMCDSCVASTRGESSEFTIPANRASSIVSSARKLCHNGHPLAWNAPNPSLSSLQDHRRAPTQRICDACQEEIRPGETYYSCRLDDFDLCVRCRNGNAPLTNSSLTSSSTDAPIDIRPTPVQECSTLVYARLAQCLAELGLCPNGPHAAADAKAYLCLPTTHVHQTTNYTCGYANCQMLISSLYASPAFAATAGLAFSDKVPDVTSLQRLLARAWAMGFDVAGSSELMATPRGWNSSSTKAPLDVGGGGAPQKEEASVFDVVRHEEEKSTSHLQTLGDYERFIVNARIQIGTTEVCAILRSRGIPAAIVDVEGDFDKHVCPFIHDYFRLGAVEAMRRLRGRGAGGGDYDEKDGQGISSSPHTQSRPPLYLQYSGHSLTVVGTVVFPGDKYPSPLIFDPIMSPKSSFGNNEQRRGIAAYFAPASFSSSNSKPGCSLSPFLLPARGGVRFKKQFELILVGDRREDGGGVDWFGKVMRPALHLKGGAVVE